MIETKMRRNAKIALIVFSMAILTIIGVYGWQQIEQIQDYSLNHLVQKYPTLEKLKLAVDSGEINYDMLPEKAKKMIDSYQPFDEIIQGEEGYIGLP